MTEVNRSISPLCANWEDVDAAASDLIARRKAAQQIKVNETVMLSAIIFRRKGEPIRELNFRPSGNKGTHKVSARDVPTKHPSRSEMVER